MSLNGGKGGPAAALAGILTILALGVGLAGGGAGSQPVPVPTEGIPLRDVEPDLAPAATDSGPIVKESDRKTPGTTSQPTLSALSVKQGEVLKVKFPDAQKQGKASYVMLAGRKASLFAQKDGTSIALVPVSVFQKPGGYPLSIHEAGGALLETRPVTIRDASYRTQNVSVSKTTEGLKPLPGELEAIQALKDTVSPSKYWAEPFMSPTIDCQNSPFGVKRLHNGVPTGDYHKGVDLRSPAGRAIHATSGGKVQIARMYRLHGGTVGLDHGLGVGSIYIHMSKISVKPGDIVKKGDVIGSVGSTGFASGPHLHWGMYVSGLPVNPNQWVQNVPKCN